MLTRCFLIIKPRSLNLGISWHADYFERSGIATVLHPSVIEMIEAQFVYLTRCFNYAVNKEIGAFPSSSSFNLNIWQSFLDLSEIQCPITGLLYNEDLSLDTNVSGCELIHRIGTPVISGAHLSTRLLLNQETADDENELTDTELFRETSESRLLHRLLLDYFDLHPHARDGFNIAVYRNKSIQRHNIRNSTNKKIRRRRNKTMVRHSNTNMERLSTNRRPNELFTERNRSRKK